VPRGPNLHERIVENTSEGVWVIDADSVTTYVNRSMAEMLGYERDELIGMSMFELMDEEGKRIAARNVERRRQGISEAHEFVFRRKDGQALWARLTTNTLENEDGSYSGALALATDITRERVGQREREQLWRILDESLNEIYLFREGDLRLQYVNRGALHNLGFTLEQMSEMTPVDIKTNSTEESFRALVKPLVDGTQEKLLFQTRHLRRDKSTYPVEVHLQLVAHEPERLFLAIVMDISEREEAERVLRESESRFRALIEHSLDMLFLADEKGQFTFASPSVTTTLGYSFEEITAMPPLEIVVPAERERAHATLALLGRGQVVDRVDFGVLHKDGSRRVISVIANNMLDNPAVNALVIHARDVTSLRKLEEQLQQSQRLESVGRLAGGIAHDFNNILTAILGAVSFLEADPDLGSSALADVREIGRAGERAAALTNQLLAFARKRFIRPRSLDLGAIIAGQKRFLRRVIGEEIEMVTHVADDLWPILADPTQLEQVIVNLAVNARDAMPQGGRLTFEAENVELDQTFADEHPDVEAGPYVRLSVSDTGEGIPEDVIGHIFEPFFTTKSVEAGTGLGLATVYGIVRQGGGHIWVHSEPGVETTFTLHFPRSAAESEAVSADLAPESERGHERLLVVEDDATVRRLMVRALTDVGYEVHSEASPRDALVWMKAQTERVHLLVTDVVMHGMSGKDLAEQLRSIHSDLHVLYVSGYTENTVVHRGELDADVELLAKPFSPAQLQARVRALLDHA
jgi:PAS domain S-box-containing protein